MPLVTMPDGQVVDMPETLTPEQGQRLRKLMQSQSGPQGGGLSLLDAASNPQPQPEPSPNDRIKQMASRGDLGADWLSKQPDDGLMGFVKQKVAQGEANSDDLRKAGFWKFMLRKAGDTPLGLTPGGLYRQVTGEKTSPEWMPDPTLAGAIKGAASLNMKGSQMVANALPGENTAKTVNSIVDSINKHFKDNYIPSKTGELVGQVAVTAPLMGVGGASAPAVGALAKTGQALATIGKGAIGGALGNVAMTPESNVKSKEEFWNRQADEAKTGALWGGALSAAPVAIKAASVVGKKMRQVGETPSANELLDTIGGKLKGKSPGEALQSEALARYNEGWDEFKKAVAPVDAEAGNVGVNYTPAITKLQDVLGVGKKRLPLSMPDERKKVLQGLLSDLEEAGNQEGNINNSFAGAIDVVKRLGAEERRLATVHGDTEARAMLHEVRDSILDSMEKSSPELSANAAEARRVFATKVAPLFDKKYGGQYLTNIRDTPTPGDLLVSGNQGALTRMKPEKAAIIAKGSSADPLLYSYLDAALKQSDGKPGSFVNSINKAMPAVEMIADPETVKAFQGIARVAKTAKWGGMLANVGLGAAIPGHALGAGATLAASFNPAYSGPGLMWKLLQSPSTRKLLVIASKLPEGSPELNVIARDLAKRMAPAPASNPMQTEAPE